MGIFRPLLWIWTRIHLWSLDVVLGAVAMCLWLGQSVGVQPSAQTLMCLALAVWGVYLADRLFDTYTMSPPQVSGRRSYYLKHRNLLWMSCLLALPACLFLSIFWLDLDTWLSASLALFVLAGYYLMVVITRFFSIEFFSKELLVALGYALGIGVPVSALLPEAFPAQLVVPTLMLGLLAWLNLNTIAWFEAAYPSDEMPGALANWMGDSGLKRLLWTVGAATFGLVWILFALDLFSFADALGWTCMLMPLAALWWKHPFFYQNMLFRLVSDGIFMAPLLWIY